MARASGKDQVAQAELDANYKPSENASYNVRVARQLAGSEKDAFILAKRAGSRSGAISEPKWPKV